MKKVELDEALPPVARTVEEWSDAKATPGWALAAAKSLRAWGIGSLVTESVYDAAIYAAMHLEVG